LYFKKIYRQKQNLSIDYYLRVIWSAAHLIQGGPQTRGQYFENWDQCVRVIFRQRVERFLG
jgi:hypothetical protein